jgi:hypothetical protein
VTIAPKPKILLKIQALSKVSVENQVLSSGLEDCEPLADLEDFGKGGVEVEPEDSGK